MFKVFSRSFFITAVFVSIFTSGVIAQNTEDTFVNGCIERHPGKEEACIKCLEFTDPSSCEKNIPNIDGPKVPGTGTSVQAKRNPPKNADGCSIFNAATWGRCIIDTQLFIIDHTVIPFFAAFLSLCSMLFETVIYLGIVKFSVIIGSENGGWITNIWGTVRDILNVGVIFVLLYAAINVIVGRGGEIKKLISGVILFGVLTNFSLFFTKAVIDISNVIALEFYNQMRVEKSIDTISFNDGLGATIVQASGLRKFYEPPNSSTGDGGGIGADSKNKNSVLKDSFLFRLAMIVVFIAVGFMFLQAAFIFLGRTVSLIFLLIFSPLMFAGGVFEPLQDWLKKWHKEFIGQVILAPVFFILLYVALTILASLKSALDIQIKAIENQNGGYLLSAGLIILVGAITIFTFSLALKKAKEMAWSVGGKAAGWGNKLGGFALGGALGGAAKLGQATLGGLGAKMAGGTGVMARAGQMMSKSSFDVRNIPGGGKVGQGINKILSTTTGGAVEINVGKGLKGREDRLKEAGEIAQKGADTEIDNALKKIDSGTKQYDIFDNKIVDANGTTITRSGESNDEWEKKVNVANKYEKGQTLAKKNNYLASHPLLSRPTSQIRTDEQKARFRAIKAQQKKLSAETKSQTDHQIRKDKLKAYKDELYQFASDTNTPPPGPLSAIRLGKSRAEIEAMSDEQLFDLRAELWNESKTVQDRHQAENKSIFKNPNSVEPDRYREIVAEKRTIDSLVQRAGKAKSEMSSLKKAIESYENKK